LGFLPFLQGLGISLTPFFPGSLRGLSPGEGLISLLENALGGNFAHYLNFTTCGGDIGLNDSGVWK